ncbi:MAG: RimK family alpha-L-glutamate ligase [Clostridia bacterium]|nr:RimK family alpha-L-glutamate ligase [Clostridia bacterium]
MHGIILYNGFWNREAPQNVRSLVVAAEKEGIALTPVPNAEMWARYDARGGVTGNIGADFVLFWDKDVRLARYLERLGMRLFNRADAIALCDDKAATYWALAGQDLPFIETWVAPMTFDEFGEAGDDFLREAGEALGFPLVFKECFGSLGGQVYLAHDENELTALARSMHARPFLLQRLVKTSVGRDKRLYVVGDAVVASMVRTNKTDFRANAALGGKGTAYTPTEEERTLALKACRVLGVEIGGVDLLDGEDGPLLCEVNSAGRTAELAACTGVDVDRAIMRYVKAHAMRQD